MSDLRAFKPRPSQGMVVTASSEPDQKKDIVHGGFADKKPRSDFDPKAVAKGAKVEMEHTNTKDLAKEITRDHLSEFPTYYEALDEMEKKLKKEKKGSAVLSDRAGLFAKAAKKMPGGYTQHGNIKGKKKNSIYEAVRQDTGDKELAARVANRQGKPGKQKQGPPYTSPLSKEAAIWDMLGKATGMAGSALSHPVGAGLAGAGLGGAAGYFGGREQLQEAAEGPFVAMMNPGQFVPALLQGIPPDQQQMILAHPQYRQMLEDQVRREAIQMLGEQVLD